MVLQGCTVTAAVEQRVSTRAFLPHRPVELPVLREILALATRAPSGGNTQPWHLYVVAGEVRDSLCGAAMEKAAGGGGGGGEAVEYHTYPTENSRPVPAPATYIQRRRKLAFDMYSLMGIGRKDSEGKARAALRNFEFFGAPVGIIVTVDRACDKNGWGHVGALLQSICLLAQERGLATCLQEAWGNQGDTVYTALGIPREREVVWCGIALGYADPASPVNRLRSERAPLEQVATFMGFPEATESRSKL
jgi:nitroreductase